MTDHAECSDDCPLAAMRAARLLTCCRKMQDPDQVDWPKMPPPVPNDAAMMVCG